MPAGKNWEMLGPFESLPGTAARTREPGALGSDKPRRQSGSWAWSSSCHVVPALEGPRPSAKYRRCLTPTPTCWRTGVTGGALIAGQAVMGLGAAMILPNSVAIVSGTCARAVDLTWRRQRSLTTDGS